MVIAGLKTMNGQLEFFDADEMATMEAAEHFMCTDVEWDPSGRYLATAVTVVHQMENGFNIWSFQVGGVLGPVGGWRRSQEL